MQMTREKRLAVFMEAWNKHDLDTLMQCMSKDCTYYASSGHYENGTQYRGREAIREAFEATLAQYTDGQWNDAKHFVSGDRGASEWRFTGTQQDGVVVDVQGCDLFLFEEDRISVKNTFRKARTNA